MGTQTPIQNKPMGWQVQVCMSLGAGHQKKTHGQPMHFPRNDPDYNFWLGMYLEWVGMTRND